MKPGCTGDYRVLGFCSAKHFNENIDLWLIKSNGGK